MTDIYKAPASQLTEAASTEGFGSLERGQAGDYEFSIKEILSEAWAKTNGAKGTLWMALLLYMLVSIPLSMVIPLVLEIFGMPANVEPGQQVTPAMITGMFISQTLIMLVTMPLGAGLFMVGLKIAAGAPVSGTEVFMYFHKMLTLFFTVVIMYIMMVIGFMLFVIPGIYLMFAYYLAVPLVVEKNLGPWAALEASRKAITKRWFTFFGFCFVLMLLFIVGMIPLGIGMIWVFPLMMIAFGMVYRNIFGYEGASAA